MNFITYCNLTPPYITTQKPRQNAAVEKDQIKSVRTGMVRKHKSVDSKTQLADNSVSLLCISARLKITDAQGVDERMSILALKEGSKGRRHTAP